MLNSFDYYRKIENPNMYLCSPDQKVLCAINGQDRHVVLRFDDLSDFSFNLLKTEENSDAYNLIETKRLIFVDDIGWFQITGVEEKVEGNKCSKKVNTQSHQVALKTRGFVSEERVYMFYNPNDPTDAMYDSSNVSNIPSIVGQLYNQLGIRLSISATDFEPDEDYINWTLIYIDSDLQFNAKDYSNMYEPAEGSNNVCRAFEDSKGGYGYDFIKNKVEPAFRVVFEFDYLHHAIKVRNIDNITKPVDVYLSFDNLMNSATIKEDAEDIITVMSCKGNDLDISMVNPMGTPYIVNFDYYMKEVSDDGKYAYPWMSRELINLINEWKVVCESYQSSYSSLVEELQEKNTTLLGFTKDINVAKLKTIDMQNATGQYNSHLGDEDYDTLGFIPVEEISVGEKSLLTTSTFCGQAFTISANLETYDTQPSVEDSNLEFVYTEEGIVSTNLNDLISGYVDNDDNYKPALYFIDDSSNNSFCKLKVDAKVGVVRNSAGNISSSGVAVINEVEFNVRANNSGVYEVTPIDNDSNQPTTTTPYFNYGGMRYKITTSSDGITSLTCYYISGFTRYSTMSKAYLWAKLWETNLNELTTERDIFENNHIKSIEQQLELISNECNIQKYIKSNSQQLYEEFENYWIEGECENDSYAVTDNTSIAEAINIAKQLMEASRIELEKVSQPTFTMSVDAVNFLRTIEYANFANELDLGRVVYVEKDENTIYRPALTSIEFDLDGGENFVLTFSNASKPNETAMTFADLLKESSSTTKTISANWSNLIDYSKRKEEIANLVNDPLNRTLRATKTNAINQEFVVDKSGILGRKFSDDSQGTYLDEQIRIVNNTILFTKDNWETASLALGKIKYGNNEGYGLAAGVIIGDMILGDELKIVNSQDEESNTISIDKDGIIIKKYNEDKDCYDTMFHAGVNGDVYVKGEIEAKKGKIADFRIVSGSTGDQSANPNEVNYNYLCASYGADNTELVNETALVLGKCPSFKYIDGQSEKEIVIKPSLIIGDGLALNESGLWLNASLDYLPTMVDTNGVYAKGYFLLSLNNNGTLDVISLKGKLSEFDNNFNSIDDTLSQLETNVLSEIDELNGNIVGLTTSLDGALTSISELDTRIAKIKAYCSFSNDSSGQISSLEQFGFKLHFYEHQIEFNTDTTVTLTFTMHGIEHPLGAVVTPRVDYNSSGLVGDNNITEGDYRVGVKITLDNTVVIMNDSGKMKHGFYCLIYGY